MSCSRDQHLCSETKKCVARVGYTCGSIKCDQAFCPSSKSCIAKTANCSVSSINICAQQPTSASLEWVIGVVNSCVLKNKSSVPQVNHVSKRQPIAQCRAQEIKHFCPATLTQCIARVGYRCGELMCTKEQKFCPPSQSCIEKTANCTVSCPRDKHFCPHSKQCVTRVGYRCGELMCTREQKFCPPSRSCVDKTANCSVSCPRDKHFCPHSKQCVARVGYSCGDHQVYQRTKVLSLKPIVCRQDSQLLSVMSKGQTFLPTL